MLGEIYLLLRKKTNLKYTVCVDKKQDELPYVLTKPDLKQKA